MNLILCGVHCTPLTPAAPQSKARLLLLSALAAVCVASPAHAALNAGVAPTANFDLTHWKLTVPIDSRGGTSGTAAEVQPSALTAGSGYSSEWFATAADGGMRFWAPVNGATTSGSHYPRSELREVIRPNDDNVNWTYDGNSVLQARLTVNNVPTSTGAVVIGQIHGMNTQPLLKLRYQYGTGGGSIEALVHSTQGGSSEVHYPLARGIALGQMLTYYVSVSHGVLRMSVNGGTEARHVIDSSWIGVGFYFKAGTYVQASGTSSTDGGRVTFYRLSASHPDNGIGVATSSLPAGISGLSYLQTLVGKGGAGSLTWSLASGNLPQGLTLNRVTGQISGWLPQVPVVNPDASFTVRVADPTGASSVRTLRIAVTP